MHFRPISDYRSHFQSPITLPVKYPMQKIAKTRIMTKNVRNKAQLLKLNSFENSFTDYLYKTPVAL